MANRKKGLLAATVALLVSFAIVSMAVSFLTEGTTAAAGGSGGMDGGTGTAATGEEAGAPQANQDGAAQAADGRAATITERSKRDKLVQGEPGPDGGLERPRCDSDALTYCLDENLSAMSPARRFHAGDTLQLYILKYAKSVPEHTTYQCSVIATGGQQQASNEVGAVANQTGVLLEAAIVIPDAPNITVRCSRSTTVNLDAGRAQLVSAQKDIEFAVERPGFHFDVALLIPFVPDGKRVVEKRVLAGTSDSVLRSSSDMHVAPALSLLYYPFFEGISGGGPWVTSCPTSDRALSKAAFIVLGSVAAGAAAGIATSMALRHTDWQSNSRIFAATIVGGAVSATTFAWWYHKSDVSEGDMGGFLKCRALSPLGFVAGTDLDFSNATRPWYLGLTYQPIRGASLSFGYALIPGQFIAAGYHSGMVIPGNADPATYSSTKYQAMPWFGLTLSTEVLGLFFRTVSQLQTLSPAASTAGAH